MYQYNNSDNDAYIDFETR